MHNRGKIGLGALVLATVLGGGLVMTDGETSAEPARASGEQSAGVAASPGTSRSVTLITGDRVLLSDSGKPALRPAPGRERISYTSHRYDGHLYMIPTDAAKLVASGRLDRRLFDITGLIEAGYDDASRATLPLIVTHPEGRRPMSIADVSGTATTADLPSINGVAVRTEKSDATALWEAVTDGSGNARTTAAGVRKVWLDGKRQASLDHSVPQIGAPAAWDAGYTGAGIKVAVLDTGVDQTHPDLADREVAEQNFSGAPDNLDNFGHGTHVASIVAGTGKKSGGKYTGVAPEASILDGKVLDDSGSGLESWIIDGMEWAAEQDATVANLSLGGADTPELDPLEQAVNNLSEQHGILFAIAAGNSGPGDSTVGSPGSADSALTVGAVDRQDRLAPFSSRGPRIGDGAIKPDITAPGVEIVAALHSAGTIGDPVEPGYTPLSGTSMATPHVAGAAALLAQQHPDWTGTQLKAALTASAKPNQNLTVFEQGSGRVDVAKAITQTVTTTPTNVSLGVVRWPHNDDKPVRKEPTYRNSGDADVTLALSVEATGPDGNPAPTGMFTVDTERITVPAGGEATVTVTGDTKVGTVDGRYTGAVVATAGETEVRTPLAVDREVESYDLTINYLGPDGKPTANYGTLIFGVDSQYVNFPYDEDGSLEVRLPKGRYVVDSVIFGDTPEQGAQFLPYPNLSVTENATVTVDARDAKPMSVTPPDESAELALGDIGYSVMLDGGGLSSAFLTGDLSTLSTAHLGPPSDVLTAHANTQWLTQQDEYYGLAWFQSRTMWDGLDKVVRPNDVATVRATFGAPVPNRVGERVALPLSADGQSSGAAAVITSVALPGERTEYYNTDGVAWTSSLWQITDGGELEATLDSPPRSYRAGRTHTERFNYGAFGPAFPASPWPYSWVVRLGNDIVVNVPLFSDSSGNAGMSIADGSTKLFRNGKLVGETKEAGYGEFIVPPGRADYRLVTVANRPDVFDVSSKVRAEWTFRSGRTSGDDPVRLPLSAVRFTPKLSDDNTAPAGERFVVPVEVQRQAGKVVRPARLTVDVSYDGGKTWKKAPVLGKSRVLLHHPDDATSVSLRATATDRRGNTVTQTIVRAYKLK